MNVKDIMTPNVEVIDPTASIQEAARMMRDLDVGAIPVCDGERIQGIVTDRDLAIRCVAEGMDCKSTQVADAMTPDVTWCYEDQSLDAAETMMRNSQIRRILVMNQDKRLVGILSLGDIAVDSSDTGETARTLEEISRPSQPMLRVA